LNINRLEIKLRAQRDMTFLVLTYIFILASKKLSFYGKKKGFNFCENWRFRFLSKMRIFFRFFNRSLAKSRRKAKIPTVLSSLLDMLTITITLRKIYFLANFRFFCKGLHHLFLRKMKKIKKFQV